MKRNKPNKRQKIRNIKLDLEDDVLETFSRIHDIKVMADQIGKRLDGDIKAMTLLDTTACMGGKITRLRRMLEWIAGLTRKEAHVAPARVRKLLKREAEHELLNLKM